MKKESNKKLIILNNVYMPSNKTSPAPSADRAGRENLLLPRADYHSSSSTLRHHLTKKMPNKEKLILKLLTVEDF